MTDPSFSDPSLPLDPHSEKPPLPDPERGTLLDLQQADERYFPRAETFSRAEIETLIQQSRLPVIQPEDFGARGDGKTDDIQAFRQAIAQVDPQQGGVLWLRPGAIYQISQSIELKSLGRLFCIMGNGSTLATRYPITLLKRLPEDAKEANNLANSRMIIQSLRLGGGNTPGSRGILLGGSLGSLIADCEFMNLDEACILAFALMTTVRNCRVYFSRTHSFVVKTGVGLWKNATPAFHTSNGTSIQSCRVYNSDGAIDAYRVQDCSTVSLVDCISEGGNPVNNIFFTDLNQTVARDFTVTRFHSENYPTNAVMELHSNKSTILIDGLRCQSPNSIRCDASHCTQFSRIIWKHDSYFPRGTRFKVSPGTDRMTPSWTFAFNDPTINLFDPLVWVDGQVGNISVIGDNPAIRTTRPLPYHPAPDLEGLSDQLKGTYYLKSDGSLAASLTTAYKRRVIPGHPKSGHVELPDKPFLSKNCTLSIWYDLVLLGSGNILFSLKGNNGMAMKFAGITLFGHKLFFPNTAFTLPDLIQESGLLVHLVIVLQNGNPTAYINGKKTRLQPTQRRWDGTTTTNRLYGDNTHSLPGFSTIHKFSLFDGAALGEQEVRLLYENRINYLDRQHPQGNQLALSLLNEVQPETFLNWRDQSGNDHHGLAVNFQEPYQPVGDELCLYGHTRYGGSTWKLSVSRPTSVSLEGWKQGEYGTLWVFQEGGGSLSLISPDKVPLQGQILIGSRPGEVDQLFFQHTGDRILVHQKPVYRTDLREVPLNLKQRAAGPTLTAGLEQAIHTLRDTQEVVADFRIAPMARLALRQQGVQLKVLNLPHQGSMAILIEGKGGSLVDLSDPQGAIQQWLKPQEAAWPLSAPAGTFWMLRIQRVEDQGWISLSPWEPLA